MKVLLNLVIILAVLYLLICTLLYFFQEKLIFFPEKVDKNFRYHFREPYEEIEIKTVDNISLNSVLFKSAEPKGVIFYLHGNAGSIYSWGDVANTYTSRGYDVFMPDYRGYGKSEGSIKSEKQLVQDVQASYNKLKTMYDETAIIVLGYSIGTGPAARIAADNHPRLLILQAPFYNFPDLASHLYPIIPTFILKYTFRTNEYLQQCKMPVVIFHGRQDEIIYYGSSVKLQQLIKDNCTLITLEGQGHNGMTSNPAYLRELNKVLEK